MADVLLIIPGLGALALDRDQFELARKRGQELVAAQASAVAHATSEESLLDAGGLAACLNVPLSWVEQASRDGRIPSIAVGRWVRFRRRDVEAALGSGRTPPRRLRVAR